MRTGRTTTSLRVELRTTRRKLASEGMEGEWLGGTFWYTGVGVVGVPHAGSRLEQPTGGWRVPQLRVIKNANQSRPEPPESSKMPQRPGTRPRHRAAQAAASCSLRT